MKTENKIDPQLMQQLAAIRPVAARSPAAAHKGRAAYLQMAENLKAGVSAAPAARLNMWIWIKQSVFGSERKERKPMFNAIASIILVLSLLLGSGGITAAAAQGSLPDDPLYQVKLLAEDLRLWLTSDPQKEINLLTTYSDRRVAEMQSLIEAGETPPEALQTRYQNQVEQAIRLAAGLPSAQATPALEKIRACLQSQEQLMLQLQTNQPEFADPVMLQTRQMLRERLQWLEEGLQDPLQLQQRLQQQNSQPPSPATGEGSPWTTGTPPPAAATAPARVIPTTTRAATPGPLAPPPLKAVTAPARVMATPGQTAPPPRAAATAPALGPPPPARLVQALAPAKALPRLALAAAIKLNTSSQIMSLPAIQKPASLLF